MEVHAIAGILGYIWETTHVIYPAPYRLDFCSLVVPRKSIKNRMTEKAHRIYIATLTTIGIIIFLFLCYWGYTYYGTSFEERPFHEDHNTLKPSGSVGHGLGIIGTLLILIGVFGYIARKKNKFLPKVGALKYWLEFHIFLCSVGPLLILFHTAFKFGGIVSISFWSMVAVVLSGIIGRFIYIQIPRTIHGRELSLGEIKALKNEMSQSLSKKYGISSQVYEEVIMATQHEPSKNEKGFVVELRRKRKQNRESINAVKAILGQTDLTRKDQRGVIKLVRHEIKMNNRISRLQIMQKLFRYWHVAHLPFALIMLVIMVIHVAITLAFGYRWIF